MKLTRKALLSKRSLLAYAVFCLTLILFNLPYATSSNSYAMKWDKDFRYKLTDYDTWIQFNEDLYTNSIGLNTDEITFTNAKMGSGTVSSTTLSVENGNVLITKFYDDSRLEFTVTGSSGQTSTTTITSPNGEPDRVTGATSWSYAGGVVTINVTHSSAHDILVDWDYTGLPSTPSTTVALSDPLIQNLLAGDVIGFAIACYTSVMGQGFYAFVLVMFFGVLYNRTKSVALCSILWLLLGGTWIMTTAIVSPIAMVLVAFGLAGILYSLFGRSS